MVCVAVWLFGYRFRLVVGGWTSSRLSFFR